MSCLAVIFRFPPKFEFKFRAMHKTQFHVRVRVIHEGDNEYVIEGKNQTWRSDLPGSPEDSWDCLRAKPELDEFGNPKQDAVQEVGSHLGWWFRSIIRFFQLTP